MNLPPLTKATFIKRYKRFLADVELASGEILTVHCPNSGSMRSCTAPGWPVLLSHSSNPKRKLAYTLEMIHNGKCWIGLNTILANKIVIEGIQNGVIPELSGYEKLKAEVPYGKNSRIDVLLETGERKCYVEVKNVSLVEDDGINYFPDAITTRGQKHITELFSMIRLGHRAVMVYLIQRSDGTGFKPAAHIDPDYAARLKEAIAKGLEILPYLAEVTPDYIKILEKLSFDF